MFRAMDARWMNETPTLPLHETQSSNARRGARHHVDMPCEVVSHYWDEPLAHTATDLSPYGMWIDTVFPLHRGAEVVVSFQAAESTEEVTVFAHVSRVRTGRRRGDRGHIGMALEFHDMSDDQRAMLAASLSPRPACASSMSQACLS